MESMETDSSPVKQFPSGNYSMNTSSVLHLWYLGNKGIHRVNIDDINLTSMTVTSLKEMALEKKSNENPAKSIDDIDILYNGKILKEDAAMLTDLNVKPNSVVHVVKKIGKDGRAAKYEQFKQETPKGITKAGVSELAIALKTMILSPNFFNAIDKLSDPQTLRNVLAVVPNLRHDPVGLAVIQDPAMILYLADDENLKNLASGRPWVIEALNFIAAGVHQQESQGIVGRAASRTPGLHSLLSYMRQIEEEDDDDRMDPVVGGAAGPSRGAGGQITREQLSAALDAFQNLSRGGGNPLLNSLAGSSGARNGGPATPRMPADPLGLAAAAASQAAARAQGATPSGTSSQPLSGDMVARAVRDAINQLPPDQRAAQLDAFRNLAMQLGGGGVSTPPTAAPTPAQQAPPQPSSGLGSLSSQYREQLTQMREMGIFDERLSVMALRVSEGDVATAVELIFSGWQGEGLE